MKYTLLFTFLLFTICYIPVLMPLTTKWKLEIKNEYGTEDPIVLKGGRFTKILLVLSPENGENILTILKINQNLKFIQKMPIFKFLKINLN